MVTGELSIQNSGFVAMPVLQRLGVGYDFKFQSAYCIGTDDINCTKHVQNSI